MPFLSILPTNIPVDHFTKCIDTDWYASYHQPWSNIYHQPDTTQLHCLSSCLVDVISGQNFHHNCRILISKGIVEAAIGYWIPSMFVVCCVYQSIRSSASTCCQLFFIVALCTVSMPHDWLLHCVLSNMPPAGNLWVHSLLLPNQLRWTIRDTDVSSACSIQDISYATMASYNDAIVKPRQH